MVVQARKRPVIVQAIQWNGGNFKEVLDFARSNHFGSPDSNTIIIKTMEGDLRANLGDWIIRGVKGEFYPCRDDIFTQTYEVLDGRVPVEIR